MLKSLKFWLVIVGVLFVVNCWALYKIVDKCDNKFSENMAMMANPKASISAVSYGWVPTPSGFGPSAGRESFQIILTPQCLFGTTGALFYIIGGLLVVLLVSYIVKLMKGGGGKKPASG